MMIDMILGDYQLIEPIGHGGMAKVFKAKHTATGDIVAVKTLPEEFYSDASYVIRFQREIDAIQRLNHPHILPVITYGEADKISYMVMPFMEHGTLSEKVIGRRLSDEDCLQILTQIASAIDHAHEHQIIHRDIKPVNIMFDANDDVKLVDFGVAKLIEDTSADITGSAIVGTWRYMSPEQCMGEKDLTPQTDIYALGIVLHEILTGHAPFHDNSPGDIVSRHMSTSLSLADDLDDVLAPEIKYVILKALARKPRQRHKSGMAMVKAFQRALDNSVR